VARSAYPTSGLLHCAAVRGNSSTATAAPTPPQPPAKLPRRTPDSVGEVISALGVLGAVRDTLPPAQLAPGVCPGAGVGDGGALLPVEASSSIRKSFMALRTILLSMARSLANTAFEWMTFCT